MTVLSCGRCGLEIKIRAEYLQIASCPRCLACRASVTPLTRSPDGVIAAAWGTRPADRHAALREPGEPFTGPAPPGR